ncbi:MAG: hypothetical protein ACPL1F_08230, partial [bacterium]
LFSHRDVSIDLTQYKYLIWKGDILRYSRFPIKKTDNNLYLEGIIKTRQIDYYDSSGDNMSTDGWAYERTVLITRTKGSNSVSFKFLEEENRVYNISINQSLSGTTTYTYTFDAPPFMVLKGLTFEFTTNNSSNANFIYQYKIEISYNNGTSWYLLQDFRQGIVYGISGTTYTWQHYFPVNIRSGATLSYNQNFKYRITIQKTSPTTENTQTLNNITYHVGNAIGVNFIKDLTLLP